MFELLVAIRFLKEGRTQTLLIIVGIAVGVAVQIFINALIGGLQQDLIQTTVGQSSHITAQVGERLRENPLEGILGEVTINKEVSFVRQEKTVTYWEEIIKQLEVIPELKAVSPTVSNSSFINRGEKSLPVVVQGFDLEKADQIYNISNRVIDGYFNVSGNEVLIGLELAKELQLNIGDLVRLLNPFGIQESFTIIGIFDLQNQIINKNWVIMPLQRAQTFFDIEGSITFIQLQVFDVFKAKEISQILQSSFTEFNWISWQEENAALLIGLQSQSSSSLIIQVFVLIAVTMGISSVLAVSAVQKSKQMGILKALGTSNTSIVNIFLLQGGLLGFLGSVSGCVLSIMLIRMFLYFNSSPNGDGLFPITLEPSLLIASIVIATIAGTIAAALPAFKTAKLNPAEVIKNG